MSKAVRTIAIGLACAAAVAAQPTPGPDGGAAGLTQSLRRLSTTARVMQITAHPDDEDAGTLTWLSRGRGAQVTLISITRGESGANRVTGDFFDRLGVLRALELRKAAELYGAEVRFTRFTDFGYSKSLEETLRNWNREEVVRDLVRLIRRSRPHVVLARWRGDRRDGHGHHQAAGRLAREAYAAAGDPDRFPDLAEAPWKPLKLYAGNYRPEEDWTIAIDSGVYDPALGETYAQLGRRGLRFQRSQGAGAVIEDAGPSRRYYKLVASEVGFAAKEQDLFERISEERISGLPAIAGHIREAKAKFSVDDPAAAAPALAAALRRVRRERETGDSLDLAVKEKQLCIALEQALGVSFEALVEPPDPPEGRRRAFIPYSTFSVATPGQSFYVRAGFRVQAGSGSSAGRISLIAPPGWEVAPAGEQRFRVTVPAVVTPTTVPWSRTSVWDAAYSIPDERLFGLPAAPAPLVARAEWSVGGVEVESRRAVLATYLDETGGQLRRRLAVGPAVSVSVPGEAGVLPLGASRYRLRVTVRDNAARPLSGTVSPRLPAGWSSGPERVAFRLGQEGEEAEARFELVAPPNLPAGDYGVSVEAEHGGDASGASFERIAYPGLSAAYLSRPARFTIRVVDVKVAPRLRIGYVMGTGDAVPEAIRELGASIDLLDEAALSGADLSVYSTIVLGIRAYAAREDLRKHNQRLLDYVHGGGVLLVQYNTPEFDHNYGPYPYKMTRRPEEVSEQDSPVTILAPRNPVFQTPNRITTADFDGWVEQRGSKFLAEWDLRYQPLLSTHDTGQAPQRGGWLVARYGRGLYVYTAYSWYRQLPYAVPGAIRLFANLISLGAPDAPWRE